MGAESVSVVFISCLEMGIIKLFPVSGKGRWYLGESGGNPFWKSDRLFFVFALTIVGRR